MSLNSIKNLKHYNGFTLAEVLITLVIIGIIAAMTIPAVINNMQDQQFKSQFAKTYSTISQALTKTVLYDLFGDVNCSYYVDSNGTIDYSKTAASQCSEFFDAFAKNLQVQKTCKGNAKSDGCIPTYMTYNSAGGCGGYSQNSINNIDYAYVLSNGQIIITYSNAVSPLFLVDINGHKGPNAYGKDLFSFTIARHDDANKFIGTGVCDYAVSGGRRTAEMIQYSLVGKQ